MEATCYTHTHKTASMMLRTLILLFVTLPCYIQAQPVAYKLTGYADLKGGPNCRYDVVFTAKGANINGYTITTQPDGRELKALIKGTLDKKNQALAFRESKMPLAPEEGDCLFDVLLSYQLRDSQYIFSGSFTGKNSRNEYC